ncbi:hypothetical protein [Paludibaculum fermentans]|uniref:Uncharacterized protein n=1 Tax=Paludibaculum fermentans TaxID=1473598 RepID=A0A7S7NL50_PALFE|nr:hypothetical protein [Paludibaculum fermentans]QOY85637.1 hypothetical protein IRI77_22760 [Paludibaculum fermentans]
MRAVLVLLLCSLALQAQIYSPRVLLKGQPDPSDLTRFANGICARAKAVTPRARAEAIWRYFLTDGRFVAPGAWYHIAGWAYEEPMGELLDPLKLINNYGFGLCYQLAPVLAATWKAAGLEDARVWFLTGHTVAEVFYDGAYHYYDSDMLGYTTIGRGAPAKSVVASVRQLESDPGILLSKLKSPTEVDSSLVDQPWYPADLRAGAIDGLADLFSTSADNSLFAFERAPAGYRPDFVLRPNERIIRYFHPERPGLYYLPYRFDGETWTEFPREVAQYGIRTSDGPRSQKDERTWGTGRLEYQPLLRKAPSQTIPVQSPFVIIDGEFQLDVALSTESALVELETSVDAGRTWSPAGTRHGPFTGSWTTEPAVVQKSAHGRRTAISGHYGYLVRLKSTGGAEVRSMLLLTRFQHNPRNLPALAPGPNQLVFESSAPRARTSLPLEIRKVHETAVSHSGVSFVAEKGQGYWVPAGAGPAEFVFRLTSPDGAGLSGFNSGGRFLDLSRSLAPDKFTAEVRSVAALDSKGAEASIAWSRSPGGPFQTIWSYDPNLNWKDGAPVDRTLRWPEVDRHVNAAGSREVFVRFRFAGLALDDIRLSLETTPPAGSCPLRITHLWKEDRIDKSTVRTIAAGVTRSDYIVEAASGAKVENEAVILECVPGRPQQ